MQNEDSPSQEIAEEGSLKPRPSISNGNANANGADNNKGLSRWFRKNILRQNGDNSLKTELEEIIQEHEESGDTAPEENTILRNVLSFGETKVSEVMLPRMDIKSVPLTISLEELKAAVSDIRHTRYPIHNENLDEVVGFLHIKDLMQYWVTDKVFDISDIIREIIYVPPSMLVNDLLESMKATRTHIAIVVDEYGGTDGLVTIEDLVEELVGEIEDEHDDEEQMLFKKVNGHAYVASARLEISKLEDNLQVKIYSKEKEDFDTIGGLIFTKMGKVPELGETFVDQSGLKFEILDADNRRIQKVRITTTK